MKKIIAALALVAGVTLMAVGASQSATAAPADKILICHATHSDKNPYRVIEVSASANGYGHHAQHDGALWEPGAETWGDVLPPATFGETEYAGQNWFGQALVKKDPSTCFPVVVTTPPTTPPTTPATTPPTPEETVTPKLPDTGSDASIRLLLAGGLLAVAGTVVLGGAGLAGRRD